MKSKPLFNKRLYKAQAGINISKEAEDVLQRQVSEPRSESNLHTLRGVVNGLKEIHKNFEYVKVALGHSITYEQYDGDWEIEKDPHETVMACYYIISGSIEGFYKIKKGNLYAEETTISYTHVAGDYIGLLSADGPRFDLPSPESFITIEHCEFIKIDRQVFHDKIQEAQRQSQHEITRFLDKHAIFENLNDEDRGKLISQLAKQEFPAGKQILTQGTKQEYAFFIAKGRCRYYRRVFLPEQQRSELFHMGYVEEGSYFDPLCILDDQESKFSVFAVGHVTCYLINKWTIKNSEGLVKALTTHRPSFHSDKVIDISIKESDQWQSYKRDVVCDTLRVKHQSSRIVPQKSVPKTLSHAIRHGTALRRQRRQELLYHPQDGLDPLVGKSHATTPTKTREETGNGKSVLKAIMLMRRSRGGSIQKDIENKQKNKNDHTKNEARKNTPNVLLKSRQRYTRSAPKLQNRQRNATPPLKTTKIHSSGNTDEVNISPLVKAGERPRSRPQIRDDCWVTNEPQLFVKKEIVNTRTCTPEKGYPSPPTYRRFGPSMFESLDEINNMEKGYRVGDPFGAKLAAEAWLKKVRASRNTYNPGPSPVIVIAELRDDNHSDDDSGTQSPSKKTVNKGVIGASNSAQHGTIRDTKSHQGTLESLTEEVVVEKISKDEWRTTIHETKYESEICLKKAKEEIAKIEQHLFRLGWSREQLVAMENKKRHKIRKHVKSSSTSDHETEEQEETQDKIEKPEKHERKRTVKRKDSIKNILEKQSSRRRLRKCSSGENIHAKAREPILTKQNSASFLDSQKHGQSKQQLTRTLSMS